MDGGPIMFVLLDNTQMKLDTILFRRLLVVVMRSDKSSDPKKRCATIHLFVLCKVGGYI